jgi:4-amino-4-deoxy-L-arabinose transferase-like glycosyltransferase
MKPVSTSDRTIADPVYGQAPSSSAAPPRLWIPTVLLALFVAQSLWFIGTQSLTYDEPAHIIAGVQAWQHGRFEYWNDHPPLGRLWVTFPLARTHADFEWKEGTSGFQVTAMRPGPERMAWSTRPMNTLLGLVLGLALWFATLRLFSEGAANLALALFAFTPSLIAHFSLATTDGIGTLFIFLTAFQLTRWRRNPNDRQMVLLGLALGGLLLSKFYAPPLAFLALALMVVPDPGSGRYQIRLRNVKRMLAALAIALVTLWAGYFFHVSHLKLGNGELLVTYPNRPVKIYPTRSRAHLNVLVPAGEFVEGLRKVIRDNHAGRPAWFLGQIYPKGGIKLYYPVAIALKWPTILLVLFFASLILGVRKTCRAPADLLAMCLFGLVFMGFALQSKFNIGERHILPLYPFASLIAGGIWEHARKHRVAMAVVILALCLNAADALRYAPDYLAYFNVFVKPMNSWRLLTDSNLDWGQGLLALRDYERRHPNEDLYVAYFGSVDPTLYGIKAKPLLARQQVKGKVVVGATCLSGQVLHDYDGYRWLSSYQPVRVLDHAMWVFDTGSR